MKKRKKKKRKEEKSCLNFEILLLSTNLLPTHPTAFLKAGFVAMKKKKKEGGR